MSYNPPSATGEENRSEPMSCLRLSRSIACALSLSAAFSAPLFARNEKGDWELGVHRGQARLTEGEALDSDILWGASAGYCFTDQFELGINLDRVDTEGDDGAASADLDFLTLDFFFNLGEDAHRPYLVFALGALQREIRSDASGVPEVLDSDIGLIDLGFGYRGYFNRSVGVRLDARLFFTDEDGTGFGVSDSNHRWWLGLAVNLGR